MPQSHFYDPALTIALAFAAGMFAQVLARHLRVPGLVLLLGAGVLLGPDVLGVVRPASLGTALHDLVGFAVAVILFEGGMNLNLARLRREAQSIRRLATLGALVTAAGGALAARRVLGWDWPLALLFGTLVIVTGPTVITPLLRRIKVRQRLATVLEAEGVLVDAIGAIVAVVALEVVIGSRGSLAAGALSIASRLGFGTLVGLAGGLLIAGLLRWQGALPEGLENASVLSLALALFQVSNAVQPESGIVAVIAAGMVVGNARAHALRELKEFKEQLTVLLIGLLFVLLAADVRVAEVRALGWRGLATVLALMLLVRPANVLAGTLGSDLSWRERGFLSWFAPRGIVAAAVSSLFAHTLEEEGVAGGAELRALVFLVIGSTVVVQGLSGDLVARLLGVRRPSDTGYVLAGANSLARVLGRALGSGGEEVVLIDSNPQACEAAQEEGFMVLHGSALEESVQVRAQLDTRAGCLGVTTNEEVNLLFARRARKDHRVPRVWVALRRGHMGVSEPIVRRMGAHVLFGAPRAVAAWVRRLEEDRARVGLWTLGEPPDEAAAGEDPFGEDAEDLLLPLAVARRGRRVTPVDERTGYRRGDQLWVAVAAARRAEAAARLQSAGWAPAPVEPA